MPTLTAEQVARRQKLCNKYRIEFLGEIDPSSWPECHQNTLADIAEVASKRYHAYATNPALFGTDPWKVERKSHAMVLVENANRNHGRNEPTWRHACESFILSRLSSEVCCRDCRKRVWRSEIEVKRNDRSGTAIALRNRQEAREPCSCPRVRRSVDQLEAVGLNRIFNFRADEEVHHDPVITKELRKRESPDRVYGLRKTRNIELLLYDIEPAGQPGVGQPSEFPSINQPMNSTGDEQLFPFLVLEAKRGSSDEWHAINMQTAFCIRTFLETQQQLYSAASERSEWKERPLVWYLSNKGENWRLCAAYTEDAPAEPDRVGTTVTRVIDVWHGCISTRDGALQLLLLVDYLFDWARDKYREDIIQALRIVAHGDSDAVSGIYQDTDIFSTNPLSVSGSILRPSQVTETDGNLASYIPAQESFLALDSPAGVVRHASFVESRYYCLYITADNVETFLKASTQNRVKAICRLILRHLSSAILMDSETLEAVEERWTGVSRSAAPSHRPQAREQFHVVMSFTTYLSTQWHQVRELCAIAVAGDAWQVLADAAQFRRNSNRRRPWIYGYHDTAEFMRVVEKLKAGSPGQILHAAIGRTAYQIVESSLSGDCGLKVEVDDGLLRDLVYFIYAWLKRGGALEPDEPYLRLSRNFDQQHLGEHHVDPYPLIQEDSLQASEDGCVLITATCEAGDSAGRREVAELCVYLTEGDPAAAPEPEALAAMLKKALETRDVYHTTRTSARGRAFSSLSQQAKSDRHGLQNIRGTYGVYSHNFGFLALLRNLGGREAPIILGSPRLPDGCGSSQLYKRNISPWIDPRYIYKNGPSRMFILYKLFTREILYWKGIAQERKKNGISCCPLCAALGDHDTMCVACEEFLADDNQYHWFRNAVLGKQPLQLNPLSEEALKTRFKNMNEHYPVLRHNIAPRPYGPHPDYDGNADWAWKLDFYAPLEDPFDDISGLALQWREFRRYCDENHSHRFWREALHPGNGKRKRPEESEAAEDRGASGDKRVDRNGSDEEDSDEIGSD
ncbi:hypothetical protein B0T14DRAFT_531878 [Immersiella caudata]|uniref:Uncharacterized protein n=1 Tax=Immersiella caudata TaxID=314043 RepID=A0AA39WAN1_9PEZI|nr:hypothetical protein B0T14DRAFT_531878 [Immersiella caudata]